MIIHYLDSSAWVKNYCRETGSQWIRELIAGGLPLASSSLGLIEVTATLARKLKSGSIKTSLYAANSQRLAKDWNNFIKLPLSEEAVDRSIDVARDQALRGADAIHLASALTLKQRLSVTDQLVLVTADRELTDAAQASGLAVEDPSEK